jgi:CubicO group peptidase (beta-lactamase class C family)
MAKVPFEFFLILFLAVPNWAPAQEPAPSPPASANSADSSQSEPNLNDRLAYLEQRLEDKRLEYHIPGMAFALVKNGEVVFMQGFGLANLESGRKVDPDTLFAIGSTTKAFTSAIAASLVDQGTLDWDDPITKYLPEFQLAIDSDDESEIVTLRDVMSHRTGFARMSVLFASGKADRATILAAASKAQPWKPFRQAFQYSNVQFLAAGVATAVAAESSWEQLLQDRILEPLGMKHTTPLLQRAKASGHFWPGYLWEKEPGVHKQMPPRDLKNIAPAGAIYSSVRDMSRWLRFLQAEGKWQGKQLISAEALAETMQANIQIAPGLSYGMGWMLHEWQGQPVIEHGGNIDGFAAQVAMLPEAGLAYVLLTNISATPLQAGSMGLVWDAMLSELPGPPTATSGADLEKFEGEYIADFGNFNQAIFEVTSKKGALYVNVPGQMDYELKAPDQNGKMAFALTDAIKVSFERSAADRVVMMRMHQGGMDFEIPRKGEKIGGELPLAEMQQYLGEYHFDEMDLDCEIQIKNDRLALNIPGEMAYELAIPDQDGRRAFRIMNDRHVHFNKDEDGHVLGFTFFAADKTFELLRLESSPKSDTPTVQQILALANPAGQTEAVQNLSSVRIFSEGLVEQSGVECQNIITLYSGGRLVSRTDFGLFGKEYSVLTPDLGWKVSDFETDTDIRGIKLREALENVALGYGDYVAMSDQVVYEGEEDLDSRPHWILNLIRDGRPPVRIFLDQKTGELHRADLFVTIDGAGSFPIRATFGDYRIVEGFRIPYSFAVENQATGRVSFKVSKVEIGVKPEPGIFDLPESLK